MKICRGARLLFRVLPFTRLRWLLLARHMRDCSDCSAEAAGLEEAASATIPRPSPADAPDFWPDFARRVAGAREVPRPRRRLSWRLAAAGAGLVILAGVILEVFGPRSELPQPGLKVRVERLRIYDAPGQAIVYQGRDPNKTFIWVEKQ